MRLSSAERSKRYRERHPDRMKAFVKAWADNNVDHRRIYCRRWAKGNTLKGLGINRDFIAVLLNQQHRRCALCSKRLKLRDYRIDHDHYMKGCESIRGILCSSCNRGLGHFNDNSNGLKLAIDYLEAFEFARS